MRIAIVHDNGPGGASRVVGETARRLAARGHEVVVWTPSPPPVALPGVVTRTVDTARFVPVLDLGQLTIAAGPLAPVEARRLDRSYAELARAIEAETPDVVFSQGCRHLEHPRIHRRVRAPSIVYLHDTPRFTGASAPRGLVRRTAHEALRPWHAWLSRETRRELAAARVLLANSRYTQARHEAELGARARVCYYGVDADAFRPLGLERERFVFCPGAIHRRKRQDLLVEALALVPARIRPPLLLHYPSTGIGHLARLRDRARELGVALSLVENPSEEALVSAYNRAAIVLYPSAREPFGLVPLEAMACGAPVLGAAEGGILESIEPDVTGRLAPGEPAAFARAIQELLEDPAARTRLGETGRARVLERWTWNRTIDQLEAVFGEVTSAGL
jgi:glycosyltransferase involved in cell wall biosynthesis